ncbi:MAG: MDR family oxidoreductase [Beijerinckiaceae bacterium]
MPTFKAIRVDKDDHGYHAGIVDFDENDLMPGDVTVRVTHSTVNYKDGLAITGQSPVIRKFPLIPGIDLAGIVETSTHALFKPGDAVVLNGWGLGETHHGGYAQIARVNGDWLVPLPEGLSAAQAMAIGTAGYTAMLCLLALERHGLAPAQGAAVVTGAAGGVGSIAVALLAKNGWHVIASTGRPAEADYLKSLGAAEIISRNELAVEGKPLGRERWIAGIDCVGSYTLANLLAQTKRDGAVAACGLAQGMDLPTTVAPFILRGISLIGINSVLVPKPLRLVAWQRLARDLDPQLLDRMTTRIGFEEIIPTARAILEGKIRGRVVVEIG